MALLAFWNKSGQMASFAIDKRTVMKTAKISGIATYHKCIQDLQECGYISYQPTHNPKTPSRISLMHLM